MNQHNKPFKCDVSECTRAEGYSTKGELQRHQKTHRSQVQHRGAASLSEIYYYCSERTCDRSDSQSTNKPFTRKDNRDNHIKRKHRTQHEEHSRVMQEILLYPKNTDNMPDLGNPEQQSPDAAERPSASGNGKRKRVESNRQSSDSLARTCTDCGSLQNEVAALKRRAIDLEDELKSSKVKVETLSEVIRGGWNRGN
jgi:hypothetical protein